VTAPAPFGIEWISRLPSGNTASDFNWEAASPAYTAIRETQPVFQWPPIPAGPVQLLLQDTVDNKNPKEWSIGQPASRTWTLQDKLKPGHTYVWRLQVQDTVFQMEWLSFCVLNEAEAAQVKSELEKSTYGFEKAAIYKRFGLLKDLRDLKDPHNTSAEYREAALQEMAHAGHVRRETR